MMMMKRRHGWQRPLHPLQIVGMSVFILLVAAFYCFLGQFLGNKVAEIAVTTVFSFSAVSAAIFFIRCTWIDPSDKTRQRLRNKKKKSANNNYNMTRATVKYGFSMLRQLVKRILRRMESKILRTFIRRKYGFSSSVLVDPSLDSLPSPLMPFSPLVLNLKDDADDDHHHYYAPHVTPRLNDKQSQLSFCSLCDFEVHQHSKHCRTCNRCVEGFDHHCRWLNNCVGKKNYTTFILLLVFVLLMLIVEGATAVAIFIRCFADKKGIIQEMKIRHYTNFPRGVLAAISVFLVLITVYSTAALGQLFFFHVLLIRKGMRTYDYILAMKEENQLAELESLEDDDSDFSSDDESVDLNSPETKPTFLSRVICRDAGVNQKPEQKLSIKIEGETGRSHILNKPQDGDFHASIDPWKLITMNQERALLAVTKAKEKLMMQKKTLLTQREPLKPLSLALQEETKNGGGKVERISEERPPASPAQAAKFSSPRRRISSCSSKLPPVSMESPERMYRRTNYDLQLENYIFSRQVLPSMLRKDGNEKSSP